MDNLHRKSRISQTAADEGGVVWIYGVGVSERVAVDQNSLNLVEFAVKEINKNQ